jgi:release factor glutamine methyltransferase
MTIQEAYRISIEKLLKQLGKDEVNSVVKLLFEELFHLSQNQIIVQSHKNFEFEDELEAVLNQLIDGRPVQQVIGHVHFDGLKILVNEHTLIPRPETEELLDWIKKDVQFVPRLVLDVCTGSGCIALALKKHFVNSEVSGMDLSFGALEMAKKSEKLNFEQANIQWLLEDALSEWKLMHNLDLVVSNPPYIQLSESLEMADSVLKYEPEMALFAPQSDALIFYKNTIELRHQMDVPLFYFELNPLTANDLVKYCSSLNLKCEIKMDMSGKARFAKIGTEHID